MKVYDGQIPVETNRFLGRRQRCTTVSSSLLRVVKHGGRVYKRTGGAVTRQSFWIAQRARTRIHNRVRENQDGYNTYNRWGKERDELEAEAGGGKLGGAADMLLHPQHLQEEQHQQEEQQQGLEHEVEQFEQQQDKWLRK